MNNKQMLYFDRTDISEGIMLIKQANQKNVLFFTIVTFLKKCVNHMHAIDVLIY